MSAETSDSGSETQEYFDTVPEVDCTRDVKRKQGPNGDVESPPSVSAYLAQMQKIHRNRRRVVVCACGRTRTRSSPRRLGCKSCSLQTRREAPVPASEVPPYSDSEPLRHTTAGHSFQGTYVQDHGALVQGDVYLTTKPKTVIRIEHEKRSFVEIIAASLLGGAIGGGVVAYAVKDPSKCDAQRDKRTNYDGGSRVQWTPITEEALAWGRMVHRPKIADSALVSPNLAIDKLDLGFTPELNMAYGRPSLGRVCNLTRKIDPNRESRREVLVFSTCQTFTSRHRFLVYQMKKHHHVVIINDFEEVNIILRKAYNRLRAIIVFDDIQHLSAVGGVSATQNMIKILVNFAEEGGTTILRPENSADSRNWPVTQMIREMLHLPILPPSSLRHSQFLISPGLVSPVGPALPYYYRCVAKRLTYLDQLNRNGGTALPGEPVRLLRVVGPRYRSVSERSVIYIKHGRGNVGCVGDFGSKRDTARLVCNMLNLRTEHTTDTTFIGPSQHTI